MSDPQPDLDPVIHAPARLRLVAALAALDDGDRIAFPRLQQLQGLTAGNLGAHLRKLEDAGYVAVEKTHRGRTPTTYVQLTRRGRQALEDHTAALRALLEPVTARAAAGRSEGAA
ncbi:transcriptional regulator [uncultured Pseudokineococcus sp.]|uniref:transcriptional regulator n=1 Tax=uncultured Pseudokineococcus sp. TaxID=1642928 RepID=UPI002615A733|nr:transcriptional regulator [uncultured Pseudokineococcus sp.]